MAKPAPKFEKKEVPLWLQLFHYALFVFFIGLFFAPLTPFHGFPVSTWVLWLSFALAAFGFGFAILETVSRRIQKSQPVSTPPTSTP